MPPWEKYAYSYPDVWCSISAEACTVNETRKIGLPQQRNAVKRRSFKCDRITCTVKQLNKIVHVKSQFDPVERDWHYE